MAHVVAINGGIGAGKSIVCKILLHLGYNIYDCDSMAKQIMENSQSIKDYISNNISNEAISNNRINRKVLANIVFKDKILLHKLNSIVHCEVRKDILSWINSNWDKNLLFIETAILYQSRVDLLVDEIWTINASEKTRITRVMRRNNLSQQEVIARINSQKTELSNNNSHKTIKVIQNDTGQAILPQILSLLK